MSAAGTTLPSKELQLIGASLEIDSGIPQKRGVGDLRIVPARCFRAVLNRRGVECLVRAGDLVAILAIRIARSLERRRRYTKGVWRKHDKAPHLLNRDAAVVERQRVDQKGALVTEAVGSPCQRLGPRGDAAPARRL